MSSSLKILSRDRAGHDHHHTPLCNRPWYFLASLPIERRRKLLSYWGNCCVEWMTERLKDQRPYFHPLNCHDWQETSKSESQAVFYGINYNTPCIAILYPKKQPVTQMMMSAVSCARDFLRITNLATTRFELH